MVINLNDELGMNNSEWVVIKLEVGSRKFRF
jgi:hypothetical protein